MARRTRLSHADYTVGWICALSLEMAAAKLMLDEVHENLSSQPNDHNSYYFGNIGQHNIVLACLPHGEYGIASAATVATQLKSSFHSIRFGLMVGIGGGVPSEGDIRLGDVVVSRPTGAHGGVVQYDYGKALNEGVFQRTGMLNRPPQILLTSLNKVETNHMTEGSRVPRFLDDIKRKIPNYAANFARPTQADCLYMTGYDHAIPSSETCDGCDKTMDVQRANRKDNNPVIHYGVIASGNQVVKNSHLRDNLGRELGASCVEMEAAGLMNNYPCLVVRGICDYADSHKNKEWQRYAAAAAAAYTKELLLETPAIHIDQAQTVQEILYDSDIHRVEASEDEDGTSEDEDEESEEEESDGEILESRGNASSQRRDKCYNCWRYGHWRNQCPDLTCDRCGSLGHYATTCTRQQGICYKCGTWGHFAETCWIS
ncbi:purine and uridine phosphorylase [Aspergillus campestris IBT 28561]|uniref:Purine and uridine phosphorylase n=1 Tax=Aspergillus campestris (strain IBT 28561) TaxID=1392248 RepID=A0A2I1DDE2_ASPC2|nr:purine and uridine phosphorylase [Aspergillus campestris IBT 28561]PKY07899.1 purine and uridine phosphorylase [Aspergillus campestris IBT 28561]